MKATGKRVAGSVRERREAKRWAEVRAAFEGHVLGDAAIGRESGFAIEDILLRAEREGWSIEHRLDGSFSRQLLVRQMMGMLERQVDRLEQTGMTETTDKESAVLGKLVATMDKLIEVQGGKRDPAEQSESREMRDIRNKLARRIDNLKRK